MTLKQWLYLQGKRWRLYKTDGVYDPHVPSTFLMPVAVVHLSRIVFQQLEKYFSTSRLLVHILYLKYSSQITSQINYIIKQLFGGCVIMWSRLDTRG